MTSAHAAKTAARPSVARGAAGGVGGADREGQVLNLCAECPLADSLKDGSSMVITPANMSQAFAVYATLRAWCRAQKGWRDGNLVGAYTEYLVGKALQLHLYPPAHPGCDAVTRNGEKYEIKGLFRSPYMWSSWASEERLARFDALAVVTFDDTGGVDCAHVLPTAVVRRHWKYGAQDQWWLTYGPRLWAAKGVNDITATIRAVVQQEMAAG
jgi:hypothetical protein